MVQKFGYEGLYMYGFVHVLGHDICSVLDEANAKAKFAVINKQKNVDSKQHIKWKRVRKPTIGSANCKHL